MHLHTEPVLCKWYIEDFKLPMIAAKQDAYLNRSSGVDWLVELPSLKLIITLS